MIIDNCWDIPRTLQAYVALWPMLICKQQAHIITAKTGVL